MYMKKEVFILVYFVIFSTFCYGDINIMHSKKNDSVIMNNLLCEENTDSSLNKIPIQLNFPDWENRPVGKIILQGKTLSVGFDTGSSSNVDMTLFLKGIKKIYGSEKKLIKKIYIESAKFKNKDKHSAYKEIKKALKRENGKSVVFHIDGMRILMVLGEDSVDGIVGINFLKKKCNKNFSIDYINKCIILDDEIISENTTPLLPDTVLKGSFLIDFFIDGIKEQGLIDTGCNYFAYRKDILKEWISDKERREYINFNPIEEIKDTERIFSVINIAGVEYSNVQGLSSLDRNVVGSNWAKRNFQTINGLGSPFFIGHKIQMDFENMEFRIK